MSRAISPVDSPSPLLLDTHTLIWLIEGAPALGRRSKAAIDEASREGRVLVSAITPWEMGVLISKKRLALNREVLEWVQAALKLPGVRLAELSPEISIASTRLPWEMHADPADRILVATTRHLGAVLVTADQKLLADAGKKHFNAMNARL